MTLGLTRIHNRSFFPVLELNTLTGECESILGFGGLIESLKLGLWRPFLCSTHIYVTITYLSSLLYTYLSITVHAHQSLPHFLGLTPSRTFLGCRS